MAIPGRRRPVPTGLVVRLSRDAPLPWGSGFASVLSGFHPGIAGTCSGTLPARFVWRRPVAHEHMSIALLPGGLVLAADGPARVRERMGSEMGVQSPHLSTRRSRAQRPHIST